MGEEKKREEESGLMRGGGRRIEKQVVVGLRWREGVKDKRVMVEETRYSNGRQKGSHSVELGQ